MLFTSIGETVRGVFRQAGSPVGAKCFELSAAARPSTLFDPRRLPGELPQIVKLCATDPASPDDLHTLDARRCVHESSLDADAVTADSAHLESTFRRPRAVGTYDDPFKDLKPFAVALDNLGVHAHGVTLGYFGQSVVAWDGHEVRNISHSDN